MSKAKRLSYVCTRLGMLANVARGSASQKMSVDKSRRKTIEIVKTKKINSRHCISRRFMI